MGEAFLLQNLLQRIPNIAKSEGKIREVETVGVLILIKVFPSGPGPSDQYLSELSVELTVYRSPVHSPVATGAESRGSQVNASTSLTPAQARQKVLDAVATAMLDTFPFDEDTTLVMDYACGTGALSQRLAPYSKRIIGVDIDENAVQQYNAKVINQGIPPEEMHAICVHLHHDQGELQGKQFDVVVCSQAYHHFPSIDETTTLLSRFLKPQGMLLVSDLIKGTYADEFRAPGPSSHSHHHHVVHKGGLTENEIRTSFERAGLTDIEFEVIETVSRNGRDIDIFLSQGVRSAE